MQGCEVPRALQALLFLGRWDPRAERSLPRSVLLGLWLQCWAEGPAAASCSCCPWRSSISWAELSLSRSALAGLWLQPWAEGPAAALCSACP